MLEPPTKECDGCEAMGVFWDMIGKHFPKMAWKVYVHVAVHCRRAHARTHAAGRVCEHPPALPKAGAVHAPPAADPRMQTRPFAPLPAPPPSSLLLPPLPPTHARLASLLPRRTPPPMPMRCAMCGTA